MTTHQAAIEKIVPLYEKWGGHATIQPMEYCAASECMVVSHRHCMAPDAWRLSMFYGNVKSEIIGVSSDDAPIGEMLEALVLAAPDLQIKYHELVDHTGNKPAPSSLEDFAQVIDTLIQEDEIHLANEREAIVEDLDRDRADLDALTQAVAGLQKLKDAINQTIERRAAAQLPTP
jgi:hypothetical protein